MKAASAGVDEQLSQVGILAVFFGGVDHERQIVDGLGQQVAAAGSDPRQARP
jgi:hypothetical protein